MSHILPFSSAPLVRDAGGDAGVRLVGLQPVEAGPVPRQDRGEGSRTRTRAHDARREGQVRTEFVVCCIEKQYLYGIG